MKIIIGSYNKNDKSDQFSINDGNFQIIIDYLLILTSFILITIF